MLQGLARSTSSAPKNSEKPPLQINAARPCKTTRKGGFLLQICSTSTDSKHMSEERATSALPKLDKTLCTAQRGGRLRIAEILQSERPTDKISTYVDWFLIALITLNVLDIILVSVPQFHNAYRTQLIWFELFSIMIFTVEYLLRIWSCVDVDENDTRPHWRVRLSYFFSPMALIDLLAILPFYLSLFIAIDLRFLRVVRILRVFKLTRYSMAMQLIISVFKEEMDSFIAAFSMLITLMVIAASGIYLIENDVQPEHFGSIPQAMWWAMATLTTVGYGDVTPITAGGKFFGGVITVASMGMVALPAGILASGFNVQMQKRQQKFSLLLKDVLRDGVVTDKEWNDLELLRKELDLSKEESELIIQLAESKKQLPAACPNCNEPLHPMRRDED